MNNIEKVETTGIFKSYIAKTIPLAFDESLSYYECLCALMDYLKNTVLPVINNNADALQELQELYVQLKEYIDNYFENLDVQEEINNKLDEMAESGELAEIISEFLALTNLFAFDTISDMASSENLVEGLIVYTAGKLTYNDGEYGYYKIRELKLTDVVDGYYIVSITNSENLVGERLPNKYVNDLQDEIDTINNTTIPNVESDIDDIETEIDKIKNDIKTEIKFTNVEESYYPQLNLSSNYNGLPFESLYNGVNDLNIQGVSINKSTGQLICNNSSEIFTVDSGRVAKKTVLFSGSYGHGGDSCIYNNNLYISDSQTNSILIINLSNGNKTTIALDTTKILNEEHSEYAPVFGGICMDETNEYCYILIQDEENNNHSIKTGSTLRLYKFDFDETYTKLAEYTQEICYTQGLTKDNEYYYIIGNKPFTGNYSGNKLYIIKQYDMSIYDTLENNSDYEHEGLDYGSYDGCEGLITVSCKYGSFARFGILSYYGNCTQARTFYQDGNNRGWAVKNRSGMVTAFAYVEGTFNQDSTYNFNNFFDNCYVPKLGDQPAGTFELLGVAYYGSNRNAVGQIAWNYGVGGTLTIRTGTNSQSTTSVKGVFIYSSN